MLSCPVVGRKWEGITVVTKPLELAGTGGDA